MGRVKFSVYGKPDGKGQDFCARHISSGTKQMKEVCEYINECCSINSSDIKGVLDALSNYIGSQLSYGYSVELEGLGYFSPALKTKKTGINEKGNTVFNVSVEGVNFRCSPELKEKVKECRPQKVKRENETGTSREERKSLMLEYLNVHPFINISGYSEINKCTHYIARNDILQFENEKIIESDGYKTHRVYKLTGEKGDRDENSSSSPEAAPERKPITGKIKI